VEKRTRISGWIVRVICIIIILTPLANPREIQRARWIHEDEISPTRVPARISACRRRCMLFIRARSIFEARTRPRCIQESWTFIYRVCYHIHPHASTSIMLMAALFRKVTAKLFSAIADPLRIELIRIIARGHAGVEIPKSNDLNGVSIHSEPTCSK